MQLLPHPSIIFRPFGMRHEQVNYCQGMNFLAALLLTWLPTQEAAFGALVVLMYGRGLRELYKRDLQALQVWSTCTCRHKRVLQRRCQLRDHCAAQATALG